MSNYILIAFLAYFAWSVATIWWLYTQLRGLAAEVSDAMLRLAADLPEVDDSIRCPSGKEVEL